jgi:hypothetical protein
MRRIITMTLLSLGLTGGVALADNHRVEVRDHRVEAPSQRGFDRGYNRGERVERFQDRRVRPAAQFERHEERSGFRWIGGEWTWNGYEWTWMPGHYARLGRY